MERKIEVNIYCRYCRYRSIGYCAKYHSFLNNGDGKAERLPECLAAEVKE
jgi:hypothetical protein